MKVRELNNAERDILNSLADTWAAFMELPRMHPDELDEFRHAIHEAQRIVLVRELRSVRKSKWRKLFIRRRDGKT